MVLDNKALNLIFYTGKDPLPEDIEQYHLLHDAKVQIVQSRPDVKVLIPNIIHYLENPQSCRKIPEKESANRSLCSDHGTSFHGNLSSSADCTVRTSISMITWDPESLIIHGDIHSHQKSISVHSLEPEELPKCNSKSRRKRLKDTSNKASDSSLVDEPKVWIEDPSAEEYLQNNFPDSRRDTWGLLYCGSRNGINRSLQEESKARNIRLHEEVFDW